MRRVRAWKMGALALSRAVAVVGAASLAGCGGVDSVVRVADGHVQTGRFVGAHAYEAFLRGALADEAGNLREALGAYRVAAAADPDDPEVWTRIGRTQCRLDAQDAGAALAFAHALRLDPQYAPAIRARAACETTARAAAGAVAPQASDPFASLGASAGVNTGSAESERMRLEALTLLHGGGVEAWDALASWATAHGDVTLAVRAMVAVAQRAPGRRLSLGRSAVALAGRGYMSAARQLAGALLDVEGDGALGGDAAPVASIPLLARLALDDALLRREPSRIYARSARAHLGLEVAAARAWCAGDLALARELIGATVKADPMNLAARVVREGAGGRAASRLLPTEGAGGAGEPAPTPLAPDVALPFARDVLVAEGVAAAKRVLAAGGGAPLPVGDALLTPIAVELAIAGVIPADALPADARIELAARRAALPEEKDVTDPALDDRHRVLGSMLLRPTDAASVDAARRAGRAAPEDPLIAVALAKAALAKGEAVSAELRANLEAFGLTDPIVAATLLDLARRGAPPASLAHARHGLAVLARTPAERARAAE